MNNFKKNFSFYWQLFLSTFYLSAFTFGGGYVIVPLMRKKFVEEKEWIREEEMLNLISIAQSAPGAMAVNTSILVGYKMAGLPGAFVTILGTILPPLIVLTVISLFYVAFKENLYLKVILKGMSAGVAAVVVDAVINMGKNALKDKKRFTLLIMIFAFIAIFFLEVDLKIIILAGGLLGFVHSLKQKPKEKDGSN